MTVMNLSFKVEGGWLVQTARNLVVDGDAKKAIRLLRDGAGMDLNSIVEVLKGEKTLVGVNELEMVDDPEGDAWRRELEEFFSGAWEAHDGSVWMPYARVVSWSKEDWSWANDAGRQWITNPLSDTVRNSRHDVSVTPRSLYYADDPGDDIVKNVKDEDGHAVVLLQRFHGHAEILFDIERDFSEAWRKFKAAGKYISIRGAQKEHLEGTEFFDDPEDAEGVSEEKSARRAIIRDKVSEFFQDQKKIASLSIAELRREILEQAAGDMIKIGDLEVPRAPYENWCLWRTDAASLAPPWRKVCPSGMKMFNDDPYHTDFIVGAGLDPANISHEINDVIYEHRWSFVDEKLGVKKALHLLSGEGTITARAATSETMQPGDILIMKSLDADAITDVLDSQTMASSASAIISERGGSTAHLVTVLRGTGVPIFRMRDAMKKIPIGATITVSSVTGDLTIHPGAFKTRF